MFPLKRDALSLFLLVIFAATLLSYSAADSDGDATTSSSTVVTAEEAAVVESNPLMSSMTPKQQTQVTKLHAGIKKHGCRLKLCFLLDASRFVRRDDYLDEKNFADLIIAITTTDIGNTPRSTARLCGATYARQVRPFVPNLVNNRTVFLTELHNARRPRRGLRGIAHAGRALRYALKRFRTRRRARAAKIVLFGGAGSLETQLWGRRFILRKEMRRFTRRGGTMCGVSLNQNTAPELRRVLGDGSLIAPIDGFFDIAEIIVATVASLCEVPCAGDDDEKEKEGGNEMEAELTKKEKRDMCPKGTVTQEKLMTGTIDEEEEKDEKEEEQSSAGVNGGSQGNHGNGNHGTDTNVTTIMKSGSNGNETSSESTSATNQSLDTAGLVAASQEFKDEPDDEILSTPSE